MAKRRVGSQTTSLTPNQKNSRIDPIYLAAKGVWHTVGKLSMRATTLLQIASQFEVCRLFLIPSRSSNMPLYPSKCCELRSMPDSFLFCYLLLGLTFESFKELGMRQTTSVIVHKTFMDFYYIINMCEMFFLFFVWLWNYCNVKIRAYKYV
jgi:hypothetical protein